MKKWQIRKTAYMLRHTTKKAGFEGLEEIANGLGYSIAVLQEPTNLTAGVLPEQRIIFLPAGVSQEYASQLLAHEIGHIALEHKKTFIDDNTRAELEADYFARCLLQLPLVHKLKQIMMILLATLILLAFYIVYVQPAVTTVYVTPSGSRYHQSGCQFTQDKELTALSILAAQKAGYTACKVCRP